MKILNILFLFVVVAALTSCDPDYDVSDQVDGLQELGGYVAFNAPGQTVTLDDIEVGEGDGSVDVTVECPTGSLSDVTVTYTLSGTAVAGEDYVDEGGGTVILDSNPADVLNNDNGDIVITLINDGVIDGDKTLTITLTSAVNADGQTFDVGRGDFLNTANILIADAGCASNLAGTFSFSTVDHFCGAGPEEGTATWTEVSAGSYVSDDFAYGTYQTCYGGPAASWGSLTIVDFCNEVSITGVDYYEDGWAIVIDNVDGASLTFTWSNDFGESGTTTLVRDDGADWPPLFTP